jgi:hypothetical protein
MKTYVAAVCLVAAMVLGASCGPIRAATATSDAKDELFKAELAGAHQIVKGEKYITPAQFEYHLAYLYLEKSKELQGFAKYDAAYFYATKAAELGKDAVKNKAEEERRKIRRQQIRSGQVFNKPTDR